MRVRVIFWFLLATAVLLALVGPALASEPTIWHFSDGGQPYAVPDTLDVVWLQGPDLAGNTGSSEIIGEFNLETEIADDFTLAEPAIVTAVRWWGQYWNGFEEPIISGFNLRFYEETDCSPGNLISEIIVPYNCNETEIAYSYYEYHTEIPPVEFQAGQHAWLSIQAGDHSFPPQWGRLQADHWEECEAMFRSEYFAYPDWVTAGWPYWFDASFALYSGWWEGEACCLDTGQCMVVTVETCEVYNGIPQGPGSDCDPNPCPWVCCFADATCQMLPEQECLDLGGEPGYLGETCDPNPCSRACCLLDGSCRMVGPEECTELGGAIEESGLCDPDPCPPAGACCFPMGTCRFLNAAACEDAGGLPVGEETQCDPNPCSPPETPRACCFPDESCQLLSVDDCIAVGGLPKPPGTPCDPNPCPPPPIPRACCFGNGHCEVLYLEECIGAGGFPRGACTVCEPNPCTQPEACCLPDGTCIVVFAEVCLAQGNQPQGEGTGCDPNPCSPVRTEETTWGRVKALFR